MKRVIIGALVGTLIYFGYQTVMWMGGLHGDFSIHTPRQDTLMACLNENLVDEGLYWLPSVDPAAPNRMEAEEQLMKENQGKPWAMVFYHKSMMGFEPSYILMGLFYSIIACLIAAAVIYNGHFETFAGRFCVAMAVGVFTLSQGVLDDMNWFTLPWMWVRPEVIDLTVGWGACSLWLAGYVKRPLPLRVD
jgi:hypothetical protein